jgi:regulator of sigma E protease
VNGKPTPTFDSVRTLVGSSHGRPITLVVKRGSKDVRIGPVKPVKAGSRWIIGFNPAPVIRSYPVWTAFGKAFDQCWQATKGMGLAIAGLFHAKERGQLTSTVGIVRVSSNALKVSFRIYLQLLAFISLSLALLNLLPLLPLDGGHILFSVIEGIRRRAVAREVYERASVIGFAVILLIAFIALSNDLSGRGPG